MTLAAHGSAILLGLERLLAGRPTGEQALAAWRTQVREALGQVRALVAGTPVEAPDWMAARASVVLRERSVLLGRVSRARSLVRGDPDLDRLTCEMLRLVGDVRRHVQHAHDLVYDGVEQELGGSE